MNRTDIKAKLTGLGIAFDEKAALKDLKALLPVAPEAPAAPNAGASAPAAVAKSEQNIVVNDPQILRPAELPLVVVLPEGASKAQQEYVKTLNAYAYKNPEKWAIKKDILIKRLRDLKNAPDPVVNPDQRLIIGKKAPVIVK